MAGPMIETSTSVRAQGADAWRGVLATVAAAVAAGVAVTIAVVHYPTWVRVPAAAFPAFQDASAIRTVPIVAVVGLASLVSAAFVAWRGLPGVTRAPLWIAVGLALVPWVATPLVFLPLQATLAEQGPAAELVDRLTALDLALRTAPPVLQLLVLVGSVRRALHHG